MLKRARTVGYGGGGGGAAAAVATITAASVRGMKTRASKRDAFMIRWLEVEGEIVRTTPSGR